MQLTEAGAHGRADAAAHVRQAVLNAVERHGGVGLSLSEAAFPADVGLAVDGGGNTVQPAGDGAVLIKNAGIVEPEQRAAHALLRGLHHDILIGHALAGLLEIVLLQAGELTVGVACGLKHGGTADTEIELPVERAVQRHGFHERKVEGGMAAAAAPRGAGHFFGKLLFHTVEKLIGLGDKPIILLKYSVQFRVDLHTFHQKTVKKPPDEQSPSGGNRLTRTAGKRRIRRRSRATPSRYGFCAEHAESGRTKPPSPERPIVSLLRS